MTKQQAYTIGIYTVMLLAPCIGVMLGGIIAMFISRL